MRSAEVLIVDDDQDFAESLALVLEAQGCRVELAHAGAEAVEARKAARRAAVGLLEGVTRRKAGPRKRERHGWRPQSVISPGRGAALAVGADPAED